ncbi:glutaredoxin family protein [Ferrimonas senticii]|uniref:glutaredoxin family protein n=1 Tax=Ferrimonas senticii TaxID=394566 RepID=UPI0004025E67|nr:glutaredoxin family protein [Ferrimonas senticii]
MTINKRLSIALLLLVMGLLGFAIYQLNAVNRLAAEIQAEHQVDVVMYGATWCGVCARARQDLAQANINYIELNVEASDVGNRQFRQLGGTGVPLFVANGKLIRGYSPQQLQLALQSN